MASAEQMRKKRKRGRPSKLLQHLLGQTPTGKVKSTITLSEKHVIDSWTAVASARGLASNSDVAKYLLSLHFSSSQNGDSGSKSSQTCSACSSPLTLYCKSCRLSLDLANTPTPHAAQRGSSSRGEKANVSCSPSDSTKSPSDVIRAAKRLCMRSSNRTREKRSKTAAGCGENYALPTDCIKLEENGQAKGFRSRSVNRSVDSENVSNTNDGVVCIKLENSNEMLIGGGGTHFEDVLLNKSTDNDDASAEHTQTKAATSGDVEILGTGDVSENDANGDGVDNSDTENYEAEEESDTAAKKPKKKRAYTKRKTKTEDPAECEKYDYFCPVCKSDIRGLQAHIDHLKSHISSWRTSRGNSYRCTVCLMYFKQFHGLHKHVKITSAERQCLDCDTVFDSHCQISKHRRVHKLEVKRFCKWCATSFPSLDKDAFHKHLLSAHGVQYWKKAKKEYLCPHCAKMCSSSSALSLHLSSHNKDDPFRCPFPDCSKAFKTKPNLTQHLVWHREKKHQCEICGKKFHRHTCLQKHRLTHTGSKTFECEECSRWYSTKSCLRTHIRNCHKGVTKYSCDQCGKKMFDKSSLRTHLRSHTGEKPFHCQQCPATFKRKNGLNKHVLRHSVRKPYKCEDCSQEYSCLSSFKAHRKKNHSQSVYTCHCGATFNITSSLEFHQKMYHGASASEFSRPALPANPVNFESFLINCEGAQMNPAAVHSNSATTVPSDSTTVYSNSTTVHSNSAAVHSNSAAVHSNSTTVHSIQFNSIQSIYSP